MDSMHMVLITGVWFVLGGRCFGSSGFDTGDGVGLARGVAPSSTVPRLQLERTVLILTKNNVQHHTLDLPLSYGVAQFAASTVS